MFGSSSSAASPACTAPTTPMTRRPTADDVAAYPPRFPSWFTQSSSFGGGAVTMAAHHHDGGMSVADHNAPGDMERFGSGETVAAEPRAAMLTPTGTDGSADDDGMVVTHESISAASSPASSRAASVSSARLSLSQRRTPPPALDRSALFAARMRAAAAPGIGDDPSARPRPVITPEGDFAAPLTEAGGSPWRPAAAGAGRVSTAASHHASPTTAATSSDDDDNEATREVVPRGTLTPRRGLRAKAAGGVVDKKRLVAKPKAMLNTPQGFAALVDALRGGALERGEFHLRLSDDGTGGTYFLYPRSASAGGLLPGMDVSDAPLPTTPLAVFKPAEEEVGAAENPRGNDAADARFDDGCFEPGLGYKREVLAHRLDHGRFAGVPDTVEIELADKGVGSLQRYVPAMLQSWSTTPAKFDAASVHAIAAFDLRVLNCDRHGGNLLVPKHDPSLAVVPIDHGFVLPAQWCDPDFEWSMWPQAKLPVGAAVRAAVAAWDVETDAAMVDAELGADAADVFRVTTEMLQTALAPGKRYTMRDLADFCRRNTLTEPAGLERLMLRCRRDLDHGGDIDIVAVRAALQERFP